MDSRTQINQIIQKIAKRDEVPDPEESLFDSGWLDSFALADVVSAIEREFSIEIPDSDLNPRKFDSVARIQAYVDGRR